MIGLVHPRAIVVGGTLLIGCAALLIVAIGTGEFAMSPGEVLSGLAGSDPAASFIVRDLRLPRALCAVLAGAALGISGAIFQSLTRNPLGSPDIVGFTYGAGVGALVVITVFGGSGTVVSAGALAAGTITALAVYVLAFTRGGVSGHRLVLVGIAISALALALIDFLLARARIEDAQEATRWLLGSLNTRGWEDVWPLLGGFIVLAPALAVAGRPLRALELGDDAAHGLGVRVERARLGLVLLSVALVSGVAVAVGPVLFVALTAPQIARRVAHSPGPALVLSALTGAALVLAADVAAQRLVPSTPLPVGVMTGAFGGVYLAWLLARGWRRAAT
ncbi:MAG: iron chelate uptake ABC transporter family permease subunit [Solirubrobacteraceae bacterium]